MAAAESSTAPSSYDVQSIAFGTEVVRVACHETMRGSVLSGAAGSHGDLTGKLVWPGSFLMGSFLVNPEGRTLLADKRVIELGCGAGHLVELLRRLAGEVFGGDALQDAIDLARLTLSLNDDAHGGRVVAPTHLGVFQWEDPWSEGPGQLRVEPGSLDAVLAAEVIYPSSSTAALRSLATTARALLRPTGTFLLVYVERRVDTTARALLAFRHAGFSGEVVSWSRIGVDAPLLSPVLALFTRPLPRGSEVVEADAGAVARGSETGEDEPATGEAHVDPFEAILRELELQHQRTATTDTDPATTDTTAATSDADPVVWSRFLRAFSPPLWRMVRKTARRVLRSEGSRRPLVAALFGDGGRLRADEDSAEVAREIAEEEAEADDEEERRANAGSFFSRFAVDAGEEEEE